MKLKRKIWVTALCCGTLLLPPMSVAGYPYAAENGQAVNEYLVQADNDIVYEMVADKYENELVEETKDNPTLEKDNLLVMDLTTDMVSDLNNENGVSVERNVILSGESKDEVNLTDVKRLAEEQWNVSAIHADTSDASKKGRDIKVAILDSGNDRYSDVASCDHISLIPESSTDDMTGHGSIIVNLIAENKNGICKSGIIPEGFLVQMYSVRILDENNQTPLNRAIEGLQWCIDNDIDIVNMSFGTEIYSDIFHDMVKKAQKAGILMIASVGNSGEKGKDIVEYPAGYQEVVGVGSVNEKMEHSVFSNTGNVVELVAPGENIPVVSYWGLQGAGSGTSYAAAHVTAVSALLWSQNPDKSAAEMRTLIDRSATDMGEQSEYGSGLVNYQCASEHIELAESGKDNSDTYTDNTTLATYDVPVSLKASWDKEGHKSLVPATVGTGKDKIDEHQINIIKKTLEYADTSPSLKEFDILHARAETNYVSAAKCLYEAALAWKGGSNYSELYNIAVSYQCKEDGNKSNSVNNLKEAMRKAVYYDFSDTSIQGSEVTKTRGKLQLLGLAIHVMGDAYAHKSICDASAAGLAEINNIYERFKDKLNPALQKGKTSIEEIKKDAKNEIITTARMGNIKYFKAGYQNICNEYFTDSTSYMKKRHSVGAKVGTNKLLNYYYNESDFKPYVFCPYEYSETTNFRNTYKYQLRNLVTNIEELGYDISSLKGKNNYSVSDWRALSYDIGHGEITGL